MINLSYGHWGEKFLDDDKIAKTIKNNINKINFSSYSTPGGDMFLRKSIAKAYLGSELRFDCCCTTVSTNLSFFIVSNIFSKTRKIGVIFPIFLNYYKQILDGSHKIISYDYEEFCSANIDYSDLSDGDICVIVLPNNPTGQMAKLMAIEKNLEIIKKKNIVCIIDVSWIESVIYPGKKIPIKKLAELVIKYDAVLLLGFTKIFGVESMRCSGVIANPERIEGIIKRHDQLAISCGAIDEILVDNFINNGSPFNWQDANEYLLQQSKKVVNYLNNNKQIKLNFIVPEAGIFLYIFSPLVKNAEKISQLCKNEGVLIYPSSLFEPSNNGFRICYSQSFTNIKKGLDILIKNILKYEGN